MRDVGCNRKEAKRTIVGHAEALAYRRRPFSRVPPPIAYALFQPRQRNAAFVGSQL